MTNLSWNFDIRDLGSGLFLLASQLDDWRCWRWNSSRLYFVQVFIDFVIVRSRLLSTVAKVICCRSLLQKVDIIFRLGRLPQPRPRVA